MDDHIATKKISVDDKFPGFCCAGFDWTVRLIFACAPNPNWDEIWGYCENPECPVFNKRIGPDDIYRGVTTVSLEDLEGRLHGARTN